MTDVPFDLTVDSTAGEYMICTDGEDWFIYSEDGKFVSKDQEFISVDSLAELPADYVFPDPIIVNDIISDLVDREHKENIGSQEEDRETEENIQEDVETENKIQEDIQEGEDVETEIHEEETAETTQEDEDIEITDLSSDKEQEDKASDNSLEEDISQDLDSLLDETLEDVDEEDIEEDQEEDQSVAEDIVDFASSEIEGVDQERPDARNVSIDFISRDGDGWLSEHTSEFMRNVRSFDDDVWTRYRGLLANNVYSRGDLVDLLVSSVLIFIGLAITVGSALVYMFGDVSTLNVLTQESSYADHMMITVFVLLLSSVSLWLSRRLNTKVYVELLRRPARIAQTAVLFIQVLVIVIVSYALYTGGVSGLATYEQAFFDWLVGVLLYLPQSVSDVLVTSVESYRGPESVLGLSIFEAGLLMVLVGLLIWYPALKRTVARFILTVNLGRKGFREETGILIEEIREEQIDEFDITDYIMGEDESGERRTVVSEDQRGTEDIEEKNVNDLIELPQNVSSASPYKNYEEHERYWVRAPYAYISIVYNEKQDDYRYVVVEPNLDEEEQAIREELSARLDESLIFEDVEEYDDFEEETQAKREKIEDKLTELLNRYDIQLDNETFHKILYYIERDYVFFNRIDPIINDPYVEDISCDGVDEEVFVVHSEYDNLMTNIVFEKERLNSFIQELAERSGEHISASDPNVSATLPDGSRAELTLGSDITTKGSTFTIRLFDDTSFTPIDLLYYDTFSLRQMAYLWLAIANNKSLIFAGGTASGKTTSMNAVSLFIPPKSKVITIEDTREIQLPLKNWLPSKTIEGVGEGEDSGVDMFDLLRAALRQRPEYIIVGEIRGEEARVLFQAMNTGHTTYSTFHAESAESVVGRFTNDPLNVPRQMITALDIICIQNRVRIPTEDGGYKAVRRNEETREIVKLLSNDDFDNRRPFEWDADTDTFVSALEESYVLEQIQKENGMTMDEVYQEIENREKVLKYLLDNDIREFGYVSKVIKAYYTQPDKILEDVENDTLDPEELDEITDVTLEEPEETLNEQLAEGDIE